MKPLRNTAFIIVASLLFCCVIINVGASKILDAPRADQSVLENRTYQKFPKPSKQSLASGEFQDSFERYLADAVPERDRILLANAAFQRAIIRLANISTGFDAYATFLDSERIVDDKRETVYRMPSTNKTYSDAFFADVAYFCSSIQEGFDNISWAYYLPATSDIAEGNPAHSLVASAMSYDEACNSLEDLLPSIDILRQPNCNQATEYMNQMFHTDHHFQIQGAVLEYRSICAEFGMQPVDLGEPFIAFEGPFYGSQARAGLIDEYFDVVYDVPFRNDRITAKFDGKTQSLSKVDKIFLPEGKSFKAPQPFSNVYTKWFHSHKPLIEYENPELDESAGSLLIIADSYINNGDRFYAENWKHVYIIDPRKYGKGVAGIRDFIEQHEDIDCAVIALALTTYKQISYFGTS